MPVLPSVTAPSLDPNPVGRGDIPEFVGTASIPLVAASALAVLRSDRLRLPAAAMLVLQQLAIRVLAPHGASAGLRRTIFVVTTAILLAVLWPFRRYAGAWLIGLGIVCNLLPIVAHGGLMPISYDVARDSGVFENLSEADIGHQFRGSKDIILRRNEIHFYPLADRYARDVPGYKPNVYSLGDFFMFGWLALAGLQLLVEVLLAAFLRRRGASPL